MTRVKKHDLVKLATVPCHYDGYVMNWETGVVLKGPYEETILISKVKVKHPVNLITLVCDVLADGNVFRAIPLELLVRQ